MRYYLTKGFFVKVTEQLSRILNSASFNSAGFKCQCELGLVATTTWIVHIDCCSYFTLKTVSKLNDTNSTN